MAQDEAYQVPLDGVTGVVLAGGRASRMGHDKAALPIGGSPLVARIIERLRHALASVMVIGPDSLTTLQLSAPVIPDARPGLGPLGGLATALEATDNDWLFLVACDMPFIQPALIRHMAELALTTPDIEAVALRSLGGLEPLHAAYRRDIGPHVAREFASPRPSMRGLLGRLRVIEVAPEVVTRLDPRNLSSFNANNPDDWQRALHLAAAEGTDGASAS